MGIVELVTTLAVTAITAGIIWCVAGRAEC
jgi:hypothetical protein